MPILKTEPASALRRIHRISTLTVAGIWIYQGLVPKLLGPHADELAMSAAFGIPAAWQAPVSYAAGIAEVLMGLLILLFRRQAWPQQMSAVVTLGLLGFVVIYAPQYLGGAFNPVVMNLGSVALSVVALSAQASIEGRR